MRKRNILAGFAIGLAVGLLLGPVIAISGENDWDSFKKKFLEPVAQAAYIIQARYVEKVEPERILEGAYEGMLTKLDEHSGFIPPKLQKEFEGDTKGEFGGLGIQIQFDPLKKIIRVEQPIPGTPAFKAGIMAGDIITKVHEDATNQDFETSSFEDVHDAVRVLRGEAGTKVTVTVYHESTHKQDQITITREVIKVPGVRAANIVDAEHKIGYIYIAHFHENTAKDLRAAIANLNQQGMKALIIDLRFNPGGLLTSSVDVADAFMQDAIVVSTRGRAEEPREYRTEGTDATGGMPLVVLVNRYSASASEIVAGAIKDNKRGLLVGEKTFGKGSVQTVIPLGLGNDKGALKLTTARYYTPSGVCIDKSGVKPDITVLLTEDDTRRLVQALADATEYPPKPKEEKPAGAPEVKPAPAPAPEKAPAPGESGAKAEEKKQEPFHDVQLERAVDILTALLIEQERRQPAPPAAPKAAAAPVVK